MSGHLGMLKTLSQICSQLIWPHCTSDIRLWVATCSHCVAVQSSCRDSSKLCFSWLITASFSILHVDLWSPGVATSAVGHTCAWRHVRPHWLCHPCPPQIHSVQWSCCCIYGKSSPANRFLPHRPCWRWQQIQVSIWSHVYVSLSPLQCSSKRQSPIHEYWTIFQIHQQSCHHCHPRPGHPVSMGPSHTTGRVHLEQ